MVAAQGQRCLTSPVKKNEIRRNCRGRVPSDHFPSPCVWGCGVAPGRPGGECDAFLGMQLEQYAGSEKVPANLSVSPRCKSSWQWDTFCYHTHTRPKSQSQPDNLSLTLRGESKGGGSEGERGDRGKIRLGRWMTSHTSWQGGIRWKHGRGGGLSGRCKGEGLG